MIYTFIFNGIVARVFILILSTSFLSLYVEDSFAQENQNLKQKNGNGFLFSIEKGGKKSYLLGTIHSGFSEKQLLDSRIIALVLNSKKIYVEADITDVGRNDHAIEDGGFYKNGEKLIDKINPKDFILYKSIFVDRNSFFSLEQFEIVRPWLLSILIPIADPLKEPLPFLKFGTEAQLIPLVKERSIELSELEGIESQVLLFSSMADDIEKSYFSSYVELVKSKHIYEKVTAEIDAWTKGDFNLLEEIINDERKNSDPYSRFYFDSIIDFRNKIYFEKISFLATKNDQQFFTVGCEHLVGLTGLVNKLTSSGFKVKKIN